MVALFVIATFLLFIAIDWAVERSKRKAVAPVPAPEQFTIPMGYFFSPRHAWLKLLNSGMVKIGIDDFVQKVVGGIDSVAITPAGTSVNQGEPLIVLGKGGRSLSFVSPVSGKIVEVNEKLRQAPELLKSEPYASGWVAIVEPEDLGSQIKGLAFAEEATQWLRREISRLRDFMQVHTLQPAFATNGPTMLDGGVPVSGVLEQADTGTWKDFQKEFLTPAKEAR